MRKLIIILALFLSPITTHASGIQVSPSKLEFNVAKKAESKKLIVVNPIADPQVFNAYLDDINRGVEISPANFNLDAGGRREIEIVVHPDKLSVTEEKFETNVSVVASPANAGLVPIGTGVKVRLTVTKSPVGGFDLRGVAAGLGVVALVVVWGSRGWKRR